MRVYAKDLFVTCLLYIPIGSYSQNFTANSSISIENFSSGDVKWVDYDSDGDLDLFISGYSQYSLQRSVIYNNNTGVFSSTSDIGLQQLSRPVNAWGDLNDDGFIDIVRLGRQGGDVDPTDFSLIAFNNGDGTFTEQSLPDNEVFTWGHVELADFDNDGDLDIYITGLDSSDKSESAFYRNENGTNFTRLSGIDIVGVILGNIESGDYDLDGDIDLLISGENRVSNSSFSNIIKVIKNNGSWNFSEVDIDIGNEPFDPYATWGDINNDGYLDILANGRVLDNNYSVALLLGSSTGFNLASDSNLPKLGFEVKQGFLDYDNDGLLDVLLSGSFEGTQDIRLYKNNGDNSFSQATESFFPKDVSSFDCADYDSDGDLDLVIVGMTEDYSGLTSIYDNSATQSNTIPIKPSSLSASVDGRSVLLSWSGASDTESPLSALSYNIRVGTTSNGIEIMAPSANIATGFNYLNKVGDTGNNDFYNLNNLPNGTYYFSVQSVDNSGGYSGFSTEISFEINSMDNSVHQPVNLTGEYLNTDKVQLHGMTWLIMRPLMLLSEQLGLETFK